MTKQKITDIKLSADKGINDLAHYYYKKSKKDYVLITERDGLYLFDVYNWNHILSLDIKNVLGRIVTKFLYYNNENYIIAIPFGSYLRIYDFKGNKKKEIKTINKIDNCFNMHKDLNKTFFIYAEQEKNYIIAYDFNKGKIYSKYYYKTPNCFIKYILVNKAKELTQLIVILPPTALVFNFHTKQFLFKLLLGLGGIKDIYLYNEQYLFFAKIDKTLNLIDLKNKTVKNLNSNCENTLSMNKINHPEFNECLISVCLSKKGSQIKLWIKS